MVTFNQTQFFLVIIGFTGEFICCLLQYRKYRIEKRRNNILTLENTQLRNGSVLTHKIMGELKAENKALREQLESLQSNINT